MKKSLRKLIPAILMVLISASLMGTSTFAWFSMNRKVNTTGMTVRTKVSESLLIANDEITSTAAKGDEYFFNSLAQEVDGFIEPVSTVNGKNFFYTAGANVQGNGAVLNKTWTAYNPADTADFATAYALSGDEANDVVGYVDYVFQIKAMNGATDSEIRLTTLKLTYGGPSPANNQKAVRVAVFAENLGYKTGTEPSANLIAAKGNFTDAAVALKAIYTPSGASNFSVAEGTVNTTPDAVDSATTRADVTYNEKFVLDVGTNRTQYYKIIVRLWLEGEDTTCNNNTFMDLTNEWSLDLEWQLVADGTGETGENAKYARIENIALAYTAAKTALLTSDAVNGTAAYTISGTPYYAITGKTLNGEQLYATVTTLTTASEVYTISADGLYVTEVTNQVTITTAP